MSSEQEYNEEHNGHSIYKKQLLSDEKMKLLEETKIDLHNNHIGNLNKVHNLI